MRDVAIVSFSQLPSVRCETQKNYIEMSVPVIAEAIEQTGLSRREIDFTCSGSTDYLSGVPFSFVHAVDAIGAWPPISDNLRVCTASAKAYNAVSHGWSTLSEFSSP